MPVKEFGFKAAATTLRVARTATLNDWAAMLYYAGEFYDSVSFPSLEILDRVGGGDSFASGLIYGLLSGKGPQYAVNCGCAHGALAMTTPGGYLHGHAGGSGKSDERRNRPRGPLTL